jgi:proline racemase
MGTVVETVEAHAAGEAGRVIMNMGDQIKGDTMAERFEYVKANMQDFRQFILREPRGFPSLCGVFITPPVTPGADYGIIVLEQGAFTPMSGSNTICSVTAMLETGRVTMTEPITVVRLDTAVGVVTANAHCKDGKVTAVEIENVPAFVAHLDYPLEVHGYGTVPTDIVFGGQFFAQADLGHFGLSVDANKGKELTRVGALVKAACDEQITVAHPHNPDINKVNLIYMHEGTPVPGKPNRNAMTVTQGAIDVHNPATLTGALDRSPCGTGTCARIAALYARGQLAIGEEFISESPIGTHFIAKVLGETKVGHYDAILPSLKGTGYVTGRAQWTLDPIDPFPNGFTLSDIWASQ